MPNRIYTINRALVLPLALNALLLLAVFALTFIRQGTSTERFLLLAALIPMAVIALESSLRKVEASDSGLTLIKFPSGARSTGRISPTWGPSRSGRRSTWY